MPNNDADRLLKRITALHNSLRLEPDGPPSSMERDLMLKYLRDLYEIYGDSDTATAPSVPAKRQPAPPPPRREALPPPVAERVVTPAPPPKPAPAPPTPAPSPPTGPAMSPEVAELFTETEGKDLAARLGKSRISDLTRAMTINNRVLFTKALFDGNNELLNTVLKSLNTAGNLEKALPTLQDLAMRHDWAEEEKKEAAKDFINLVKRRYA